VPKPPPSKTRVIALDTETTGLDLYHGARPFLVTVCDEDGQNTYWEWDVDPLTRRVQANKQDLEEVQEAINRADLLVLQNPKFDYAGLRLLFADHGWELQWDWNKVRDTLLAGHLLASNQPHDLTTMAAVYLKVNILPLEVALKEAVNECRRWARREHEDWLLAEAGLPCMPSAKGSAASNDYWLPRRVAAERGEPADHPYWTVCAEYANGDSATTVALYRRQMELIERRGLARIYAERLKVLPIVVSMEQTGVTVSGSRLKELSKTYRLEADKCRRVCINLSGGKLADLPVSGTSNALKAVVYGQLGLKSNKRTKGGNDSMDKTVLEHWLVTLPERSRERKFVQGLRDYRKRMTAVNYLQSYTRFWLPLPRNDWFVLHPSLNPTGTDTLRWSSSNPNEQNISKQDGFNLRYCFGPAPGREWWSLDAKNIELRIPAYEAGETEMVALFEQPDEPPYYGSNHLLVAHVLYPEKFDECLRDGVSFKDRYKATLYQWVKNGNFAVQYGAVEASGTADRAYHVPGGQAKVQARFQKIKQLNERMIAFAEQHGYVETMPDRTVDPERGYPLLCSRSAWGGIQPTVPLNYHVQGTAMWWMMKAMIRCYEYLRTLGGEYRMIMQVHDELVFDFPKGTGPQPWKTNLPKIRRIKRLMEQGGNDIGLPTPVSVEYHTETWSKGMAI
jgi:DNA polymerase I-like protein with 3'-5' exonuclease and polymerase domains